MMHACVCTGRLHSGVEGGCVSRRESDVVSLGGHWSQDRETSPVLEPLRLAWKVNPKIWSRGLYWSSQKLQHRHWVQLQPQRHWETHWMSCPRNEPKQYPRLEAQPTSRWIGRTLPTASAEQIKTLQNRKCEPKRDWNELLGICWVSCSSSEHFRIRRRRRIWWSELMWIGPVKDTGMCEYFSLSTTWLWFCCWRKEEHGLFLFLPSFVVYRTQCFFFFFFAMGALDSSLQLSWITFLRCWIWPSKCLLSRLRVLQQQPASSRAPHHVSSSSFVSTSPYHHTCKYREFCWYVCYSRTVSCVDQDSLLATGCNSVFRADFSGKRVLELWQIIFGSVDICSDGREALQRMQVAGSGARTRASSGTTKAAVWHPIIWRCLDENWRLLPREPILGTSQGPACTDVWSASTSCTFLPTTMSWPAAFEHMDFLCTHFSMIQPARRIAGTLLTPSWVLILGRCSEIKILTADLGGYGEKWRKSTGILTGWIDSRDKHRFGNIARQRKVPVVSFYSKHFSRSPRLHCSTCLALFVDALPLVLSASVSEQPSSSLIGFLFWTILCISTVKDCKCEGAHFLAISQPVPSQLLSFSCTIVDSCGCAQHDTFAELGTFLCNFTSNFRTHRIKVCLPKSSKSYAISFVSYRYWQDSRPLDFFIYKSFLTYPKKLFLCIHTHLEEDIR